MIVIWQPIKPTFSFKSHSWAWLAKALPQQDCDWIQKYVSAEQPWWCSVGTVNNSIGWFLRPLVTPFSLDSMKWGVFIPLKSTLCFSGRFYSFHSCSQHCLCLLGPRSRLPTTLTPVLLVAPRRALTCFIFNLLLHRLHRALTQELGPTHQPFTEGSWS